MAEAGSFAEKVNAQQVGLVRVVGDYVRLNTTGKDFSGLCPFHQEKTPLVHGFPHQTNFLLLRVRQGR